MSWVRVRDLLPKIIANYEAGNAPDCQREADSIAFEDWEAQPDPDEVEDRE